MIHDLLYSLVCQSSVKICIERHKCSEYEIPITCYFSSSKFLAVISCESISYYIRCKLT